MKIRQIDLRNFRQFYGHQRLDLSCSDDKNVTLVHAENGIGKTTLLNSVYWAMFGDVTPRFEQRRRLVNFEAEKEGVREASVEVEFEFNDKLYRAVRRYSLDTHQEAPSVSLIDNGSLRPLPAPDTFINSVIPRGMAKYFFFDGEHAESFAAEQNTTAGAAIRSMLGCDLAERGIQDLEEVSAQFTRLMGSVPGDSALNALRDKLSRLEEQQAADHQKLSDAKTTIAQKKEQRALIEEQLRRTAGAKEIQQLRDELEVQLKAVKDELRDEEASEIRWIGEKGLAVVSRKIAMETSSFIDEEALRGRIPRPYNEIFIKGLMEKEKCICCRQLKPQTPEWLAVAALLQNAGNAESMGRVVRALARLQGLHEQAQGAPKELATIGERIGGLVEKRRDLEQKLEEAGRKLENYNLEEVREREAARVQLGKDIEDLNKRIWDLEKAIRDRAGAIDDNAEQLKKKVAKNDRAKGFMSKRQMAILAGQRLRKRLNEYEDEARSAIVAKINGILAVAARRDYRFEFDEDFGMSLHHKDIDGPVPKSGGENQLMSLAFTAALVDFSRSRLGLEHAILSPGTVAPLVLDAPIGHLDESYRSATAAFLPNMAAQILLLLSSGHTKGGVLQALKPRVGRQYILVSENRSPRDGRSEDTIVINGKSYSRSLFNQERNLTRILEVERSNA